MIVTSFTCAIVVAKKSLYITLLYGGRSPRLKTTFVFICSSTPSTFQHIPSTYLQLTSRSSFGLKDSRVTMSTSNRTQASAALETRTLDDLNVTRLGKQITALVVERCRPESYLTDHLSSQLGADVAVLVTRAVRGAFSKIVIPVKSKDVFQFAELPAEVRNAIYALALKDDSPIEIEDHHVGRRGTQFFRPYLSAKVDRFYGKQKRKHSYGSKHSVNLLLVDRSIYNEVIPVLYGANHFVFANLDGFDRFAQTIGKGCELLRSLFFDRYAITGHMAKSPFWHLQAATNLERLVLEIKGRQQPSKSCEWDSDFLWATLKPWIMGDWRSGPVDIEECRRRLHVVSFRLVRLEGPPYRYRLSAPLPTRREYAAFEAEVRATMRQYVDQTHREWRVYGAGGAGSA